MTNRAFVINQSYYHQMKHMLPYYFFKSICFLTFAQTLAGLAVNLSPYNSFDPIV